MNRAVGRRQRCSAPCSVHGSTRRGFTCRSMPSSLKEPSCDSRCRRARASVFVPRLRVGPSTVSRPVRLGETATGADDGPIVAGSGVAPTLLYGSPEQPQAVAGWCAAVAFLAGSLPDLDVQTRSEGHEREADAGGHRHPRRQRPGDLRGDRGREPEAGCRSRRGGDRTSCRMGVRRESVVAPVVCGRPDVRSVESAASSAWSVAQVGGCAGKTGGEHRSSTSGGKQGPYRKSASICSSVTGSPPYSRRSLLAAAWFRHPRQSSRTICRQAICWIRNPIPAPMRAVSAPAARYPAPPAASAAAVAYLSSRWSSTVSHRPV